MAFIQAIIKFVNSLPGLLKILDHVLSIIIEQENRTEASKRTKELGEAIEKARTTKDTSDLDKFFNGGANRLDNNGGDEVQRTAADVGN